MRTTLVIDDGLARRAREAAARSGTTLSALVSRALRTYLERPPAPEAEPFVTIQFGGPRPQHHEPAALKAALEDDEVERHRPG